MKCPYCGSLVQPPTPVGDKAQMVHSMFAKRRVQGIYRDEASVRKVVAAMYWSQPELAEAAIDGWRSA